VGAAVGPQRRAPSQRWSPVPDDAVDDQTVFEVLADTDCRILLAALDRPLTASEVTESCDLPQTSAYRKLEQLVAAGLVEERTRIDADGHHATAYVRDCEGLVVDIDNDPEFGVRVLREREGPDERLAKLWTRVSEEL